MEKKQRDKDWDVGIGVIKWVGPALVLLVLFGVYVREINLRAERHYAPQEEQIRRDTFKKSQAYNDGMAQDLNSLWLEYGKVDATHKAAIRSIVLHRVAGYPVEDLQPYLHKWINELRQQQGGAQ